MTSIDVLLPEGTRLVHIGPHKTGTTTLQGAFHAARREVERQGVHYASPNRQAKQAARAVAGVRSAYADGRVVAKSHWTNLVREVERSKAKRVVISAEAFADASQAVARRMVADLDPSVVHVVVTLRPLARIMPSQWQQYVQNGLQMTYEAWLRSIFESPERPATPSFWHRHRHHRLITRWAEVVGAHRFTVVVVDDRDHESSLRAFEQLLGLRARTLQAAEGIYNRSLTASEVELIRALHTATAATGIDKGLRLNMVLHGAAANMKLRVPVKGEAQIETPAWAQERVAVVAREIVDGIRAAGVRVIGDLEMLVDPGRPARPVGSEGAVERATATPWPAIGAQALMGVLIQSGLTRRARSSGGEAWPDTDEGVPMRASAAPSFDEWSTPRLSSMVAGRLRWAVAARVRGPLKLLRRARRRGRGQKGT